MIDPVLSLMLRKKLMDILVFSLIAIAVTAVLSFLDSNERRYYYFAIAIIAGGVGLTIWAYQSSRHRVGRFFRSLGSDILRLRQENGRCH